MAELSLFSSAFVEISRTGRHVVARLRAPANVLSTCPVNGGLRRDLSHLVNHQSCEPAKHQERFEFITRSGPRGYHGHVCSELGLDSTRTAVLGTAAAMQYLGLATHAFADLSVTALVTAGVTGNAGCAGDPAHYDETNGTWFRIGTPPASAKPPGTVGGTINTLLLFSSQINDGAISRAVMTMTEAKASALAELAVGSKSSWRLATGTGTDQFAIAAPADGDSVRTWTGKHTKAGELVGQAVREATLEALRWQNGLERSYTRSLFHALGRFGLSEDRFKEAMESRLSPDDYLLLKANWNPVVYEPQLAAAAYAYASVLERALFGTIPASTAAESLLNQAALMASGLAVKHEAFPAFRSTLAPSLPSLHSAAMEELPGMALALTFDAIALGWRSKWRG